MTALSVQTVATTLAVAAPAPTQLVAALDPPAVLTVAPDAATLAVTLVRTGVLAAPAAQGPMGPPGVGSIGDVATVEHLATVDGAQTLILPRPATTAYSTLCINGLRQSRSAYTIAGAVLTLPADLLLMSGDTVALDYA